MSYLQAVQYEQGSYSQSSRFDHQGNASLPVMIACAQAIVTLEHQHRNTAQRLTLLEDQLGNIEVQVRNIQVANNQSICERTTQICQSLIPCIRGVVEFVGLIQNVMPSG